MLKSVATSGISVLNCTAAVRAHNSLDRIEHDAHTLIADDLAIFMRTSQKFWLNVDILGFNIEPRN